MVKIRWLGHACFEITGGGLTIVTDPHDGLSLGLPPPRASADIVLVSHGHFDHADGKRLVSKPGAIAIDKPGLHEVKGLRVKGVPSHHDEAGGSKRGSNTIFKFELEGIKFCHLGDLGHVLTPSQVAEVGEVDVLFTPVGGTFTLDASAASKVVDQLKPKLVIPMHFRVPGLKLPISDVEPFLRGKERVERLDRSEVEVVKDGLPAETKVVVLKPPR
ncbi:MAG: MBL fold metallo-hydrolase [Candidatus Nezhaarchaeota archaeon]|nr:MBL fold metallo-hydrolase [Candidatus Nezhaarchaeota archaeon]